MLFYIAAAQAQHTTHYQHEPWVCGNTLLPPHFHGPPPAAMKVQHDIDHIIIPVVVHVIHNGEVDFPAMNDSISYEQVASEFVALNDYFRCVPGTMGKGAGVDTRMEFQLVNIDPDGNPTTGVVYHVLPDKTEVEPGADGFDPQDWDQSSYYNVYLVTRITGDPAGYASSFRAVIESRHWGTVDQARGPYTKTGAHELGHAFGLNHPFAGGCSGNNDEAADTPAQARSDSKASASRENSCPHGEDPDMPDPHNNYMDYLGDLLPDTFTEDQRQIMWASASSTHATKWTDANMLATGTGKYRKPKAQFHALQQHTCVGGKIQLTDYSLSWPTTYSWTVTGGTPTVTATYTQANPLITLPNPGSYDVQLVVGNLSGQTDTLKHIALLHADIPTLTLPLAEDFEGGTFPPTGWQVLNPDAGKVQQHTFRATSFAGYQSSKSVFMESFTYHRVNQWDHMLLPAVQYTRSKPYLELAFDLAYAANPTFQEQAPYLYRDSLFVYSSTNCGETWQLLQALSSHQIATTEATELAFNPSQDAQWKRRYFYLEPPAATNVMWKLSWKNGHGNNVYIDNLQVQETTEQTVSRDHAHALTSLLQVYPNPSTGMLNIQGMAGMQVRIINSAGQQVYTRSLPQAQTAIDLQSLRLPAGLYHAVCQYGTQQQSVTFAYLPY